MTDTSWNKKRRFIRDECRRRGILVEQRGKAVRLTAPGVDLMVIDLSWLTLEDLEPRFRPPAPLPRSEPFSSQ